MYLALILTVFCFSFSSRVNVDKQPQELLAKMNTIEYPAQIDEKTILDSLSVASGRNLYYHYTLLTLT
ncbi:MAG: hypothetical protein LBG19_02695 [Prevotellaceae bacterium]|nr:hypothetical protein [Prevotellaceae bacterium]